MTVYNGKEVPKRVRVSRIVSAFANGIDPEAIAAYQKINPDNIKPINGYPSVVCDEDVGDYFMTGEEIGEEHVGEDMWYVTDGHHRVLAWIEMGMEAIEVKIDPSCLTSYDELKMWRENE